MNYEPLNSLAGRWPDDTLPVTSRGQSVSEISNLFNTWDALVINTADSQALQQFAAANDFTYSPTPLDFIDPSQTYAAAWHGLPELVNTPQFFHEMTGTIFGYPTKMCLEYRPSSIQQTNPTDHKYKLDHRSVIRISLPKLFPQMVLDSNKNDGGVVSTIPTSIRNNQKVALEGNFANYFDFYAPAGLQANSLTVLAPNFMEILINMSETFDVEFYGTELIFITKEPLYTPQVMQSALKAMKVQLDYLNRLMQSWNYAPNSQPFDRLQYSFINGPTVIKTGSIRINPLGQLIGIGLMFVLFALLILAIK